MSILSLLLSLSLASAGVRPAASTSETARETPPSLSGVVVATRVRALAAGEAVVAAERSGGEVVVLLHSDQGYAIARDAGSAALLVGAEGCQTPPMLSGGRAVCASARAVRLWDRSGSASSWPLPDDWTLHDAALAPDGRTLALLLVKPGVHNGPARLVLVDLDSGAFKKRKLPSGGDGLRRGVTWAGGHVVATHGTLLYPYSERLQPLPRDTLAAALDGTAWGLESGQVATIARYHEGSPSAFQTFGLHGTNGIIRDESRDVRSFSEVTDLGARLLLWGDEVTIWDVVTWTAMDTRPPVSIWRAGEDLLWSNPSALWLEVGAAALLRTAIPQGGFCEAGNCVGGQGEARYPDGRYTGAFAEGLRSGDGEMRWHDSTSHKGRWREGLPDGVGVRDVGAYLVEGVWRAGVYQTSCEGDCQNGSGTQIGRDYRRYQGTFRGGERSGFGLLFFPEGGFWSGPFFGGELHGVGTLSLPGAEPQKILAAQGQIVAPCTPGICLEGRGSGPYVDLALGEAGGTYTGLWQSGFPHGKGTVTWEDGFVIEGTFDHGYPHGEVHVRYTDGSEAWIEMVHGRSGYGRTSSAGGLRTWTGPFSGYHPNGKGWMSVIGGESYPLTLKDGVESQP